MPGSAVLFSDYHSNTNSYQYSLLMTDAKAAPSSGLACTVSQEPRSRVQICLAGNFSPAESSQLAWGFYNEALDWKHQHRPGEAWKFSRRHKTPQQSPSSRSTIEPATL